MPSAWECPECCNENEAGDATCQACDASRPDSSGATEEADSRYAGYKIGLITTVEELSATAGGKKLRKVTVDVGAGAELVVVTNAPNVKDGMKTVVATPGAVVEADGESVKIKPTSVGGVISQGMLCDSGMLGWTGGGAGNAVVIPDSFAIGACPPDSRPRGDAK
eukprot:GILI01050325.1.p1 GENE.GILI01050325.1~~GILI01050325.1.p1  ORF type:complete len:165 (+),score=44.40 GILI01050325.1:49-543(+)